MSSTPPTNEAATGRRTLRSLDSGVLASLSLELPGYPFGSLTPYVMTHAGELVLYVSSIAQHTRNMQANPKVSLTVVERAAGNPQALARVTVVGDASPVPEASLAAVSSRYYRLFPESEAYAETHGFSFFWIEPRRIRYIGGFGRIFWIEAEDWRMPTPAWAAEEPGILEHMNADHADALERIAGRAGGAPGAAATLVAVDPEGAHVRAGEATLYVPFREPALDMEAVRAEMVALARGE